MAKKIIWTKKAQQERIDILSYWIENNKSKTFSIKLNKLFVNKLKLLSEQPYLGKKTEIENIFVKVVKYYLLIYEIREEILIVLSIWDSRRNPESFKIR